MKRILVLLIVLCCLFAGCTTPYSGSYVSVTPYETSEPG